MADETPQLNGTKLPWYRGLNRYQWWVLVVATMGWLFDTMDQQFFNLGRGPAMREVLGVSPVDIGLETLGEDARKSYTASDLQALVNQELITAEDARELLIDREGEAVETASRKDVAKVIGDHLLRPKYIDLGTPLLPERLGMLKLTSHYGREVIAENAIEGESFDRTELEALAEEGKISYETLGLIVDKEQLDTEKHKAHTVSDEELALYIGKQTLLTTKGFSGEEVDALVSAGLLSEEAAGVLPSEGGDDATVYAKDVVLRAIGRDMAEQRETISPGEMNRLFLLDLISKEAADELIEAGRPITPDVPMTQEAEGTAEADIEGEGGVAKGELIRYFGKQKAEQMASDEGNRATMIFIFGWAIGGLFFGWVGDTLGRAKTMALAILTYAVFTGLNGLAQTPTQFHVFRFLTALGVGGEFAAGAALVAETMPERSRAAALGALQALSAVGNMMGAALAFFIMPTYGWRWLFAIGALPALLAVVVRLKLKEPDKWVDARKTWLEKKAAGTTDTHGSYLGLFTEWRWARRAIIGLLLGVVGVGGLWGVAFFTPELNRLIARHYSEEAKERFVAAAFFLQQFGAFFGIAAYTWIALRLGRKPAFAIFFVMAFVIVSYTFIAADTITEAYVLAPLVGFVTLGPFGGYAIYFPELFPTRLRSTGVGFCYNVGRFLAALVPQFKSGLQGLLISGAFVIPFLPAVAGSAERAVRYGSFLMIFIYIIGLIVLLFAPETKDQPLPED